MPSNDPYWPGKFTLFDGLLFTGRPDLTQSGMPRVRVITEQNYFPPGTPKEARALGADPAYVRDTTIGTRPGAPFYVQDIEEWSLKHYKCDVPTVLSNIVKHRTVLSAHRAAEPHVPHAIYVCPPREYFGSIGKESNSDSYQKWISALDMLWPLLKAVDIFTPSMYMFYDDQAAAVTYLTESIAVYRKYSEPLNKPIIPLIWPQFHPSHPTNPLGLISGAYWRLILDTLFPLVDSLIIWGGYGIDWDDQAEWWLETEQFKTTHGL
jgi:hypothetical protein